MPPALQAFYQGQSGAQSQGASPHTDPHRTESEKRVVDCYASLSELKNTNEALFHQLIQKHGSPGLKETVFQDAVAFYGAQKENALPEGIKNLQDARLHETRVPQEGNDPSKQADAATVCERQEAKAAACPASMAYLKEKDPTTYDKLTQIRQETLQRDRSRGLGL